MRKTMMLSRRPLALSAVAIACRNMKGRKMKVRSLSLWAVLVLLVSVVGAWAQSGDAPPAQTKGIDPALLARAQAGDANAEVQIGWDYEDGKGVQQDYAQAAVWFRKAAEQGNFGGEAMLALLYRDGLGVKQDEAQAAVWFRKAADQDFPSAQLELGTLYHRGRGVEQDDAQAALWWLKAAKQGNADAQSRLGFAYYNGQGVPQDFAQAAAWCSKAAEQGNANAQFYLGLMYHLGHGVPQDSAQAAYWYRKAAEQGAPESQYNLALMYAKGEGVPQDYAEAYFWTELAAVGKVEGVEPDIVAHLRDQAASFLTQAVLLQTQERARNWFAAHQSEAATVSDTSNETGKDSDTSFASSSAQNPATQEWVKAETDQIRAMVQAIKQCPASVNGSAASTIVDGPPYNVTWDVSASQSVRAPYAGVIELTVPTVTHCSPARRQSSPMGCAVVERPEFPLVLRYEYDLSPDGLSLSKILVRRDNETEWSNRPNVSNYCWERAAQLTQTAR